VVFLLKDILIWKLRRGYARNKINPQKEEVPVKIITSTNGNRYLVSDQKQYDDDQLMADFMVMVVKFACILVIATVIYNSAKSCMLI
jgi:hypothetical protein